jgi:galactose mutarotase-like enzyme
MERIENDFMRLELTTHGAEPLSWYHKKQKREYLWQADAAWWPRHAPVLFPIVGKLNANEYRVGGQCFSLPQHGFARDSEFAIAGRDEQSIRFVLRSVPELAKIYPFPFELSIGYRLQETTLQVAYAVTNTGTEDSYFSIGGHPGFALAEGEKLSDYRIEFEYPETLERHLLEGGLFTGNTERVVTSGNVLALNDALFEKDAIVLKGMKSTSLMLRSPGYELKFSFPGFPFFGIWSRPGAGFVCLEPWCGLADKQGFVGEFREKEGVERLAPGVTSRRSFEVEIYGQ